MRRTTIAIGIFNATEPLTDFPNELSDGRGGLLIRDEDEEGAIVLQIKLESSAFLHG